MLLRRDAGRHDVAVPALRRALALAPGHADAFAQLVHSLQCVCDWEGRDGQFAALAAATRAQLDAGGLPAVQPFHAMAFPFPSDLVLDLSTRYAEHIAAAAAKLGAPALAHPPRAPLRPGQRLRIALVSSDFGDHPLSHLMGSVPRLLAAGGRVEAFCYALSPPDGSEWRSRIEARAACEARACAAGGPLSEPLTFRGPPASRRYR
jgi:protein O-GlcNAc transferase